MDRDIRAADRVRAHTSASVRERIDRETEASIARHGGGAGEAIVRRLEALDREWDVDRALMANLAVVGGLSFAAGAARRTRARRWNGWFTLFSVQLGFLLWHAALGWCPPLPVFRRLGFRTQREILAERDALEGLLAARGR